MYSEDKIEEALWGHIDQLVQEGSRPVTAPGSKALYNGHDPEKLGALSNSLFANVFEVEASQESSSTSKARESLQQLIAGHPNAHSLEMATQSGGSRRSPRGSLSRKRWGQVALIMLLLTIVALALARVAYVVAHPVPCVDDPPSAQKTSAKNVSAVVSKKKCDTRAVSKASL